MSLNDFEPIIGLEIHAQLKTNSKIFSSDATNFDAADNENTNPVSVGMPGTLPVLNKQVLELAIKTALGLGAEINTKSVFARKNYFYPDLPKGYQISQYDLPFCVNGSVKFLVNEQFRTVKIERAHLEEDAGKSTHLGDSTLLNFNRAGIPLMEIVSAPEIKSAQEAAEYAKAVRQILRYLNVCDGNLEEGSLRCDCNVSVRRKGETKFGTKVEIKNINSFRFVEKAIDYEIDRQIDVISRGEKIIQETRLWDPDKNRTFSMRTKEDAQDYRYFPDPDLLPVRVLSKDIQRLQSELPELPLVKMEKFTQELNLPMYDALVLTSEKEISEYFEIVAKISNNPKASSNWIMTDLMREINTHGMDFTKIPIKPENLALMIIEIDKGTVSGKIGKTIFTEMWNTGKDPLTIIKEKNLVQITDTTAIEKIIDDIIQQNLSQVQEYRSGKIKLLGFFVGLAMKATKGQASPDIVNKILQQKLQS